MWRSGLLLVLFCAQHQQQGDARVFLTSPATDSLYAATPGPTAPRALQNILYRHHTGETTSAGEGAEHRRLLLGHVFSSSGLGSVPWPSAPPEKPPLEQQVLPEEQLVPQPAKAKALGVRTLQLLQRAKRSAAAAAAAARAAALGAIPKDEAGQRLISGALTRLYVQTLLYPIGKQHFPAWCSYFCLSERRVEYYFKSCHGPSLFLWLLQTLFVRGQLGACR